MDRADSRRAGGGSPNHGPASHPAYYQATYPPFVARNRDLLLPTCRRAQCPTIHWGKIRRWSSFVTFTASDFLFNGAIATVNGVAWDVDDQAGQLLSDSSYRYSRNILLGLYVAWYLGRSGRHTDHFLESKSQRINELEFTISYEIRKALLELVGKRLQHDHRRDAGKLVRECGSFKDCALRL